MVNALTLNARDFAAALLLETLATWQEAILPSLTCIAQNRWGDKWESECANVLSTSMKEQLSKGGGWDVYRIVSVILAKQTIFMQNYDTHTDCAREIYRQVSFHDC